MCWSVEGAVARMSNNWGILPPYFMLLLDDVAREYGVDGINLFEDFVTHDAVVELLEKATTRA